MNDNPFTLTFGKEPKTVIGLSKAFEKINDNFTSNNPASPCVMISGVRGSGKTVLLTQVSKSFAAKEDWIVVELNPETDMLEYLASNIFERAKLRKWFIKAEWNFSFRGVSLTIPGDNPVTNVTTLLEKMFDILARNGKKVLVCIDEVSNVKTMRLFAQQFQIFIRGNRPIFLLMTGLFENIRSLQNRKSLTFLYRAPRVETGKLNTYAIMESFKELLGATIEDAHEMAKLTNGYAFAYQALGFILYESHKKAIDDAVLKKFDDYLIEFVYEKIYDDLPGEEKRFAIAIAESENQTAGEIMEALNMTKEAYSSYRDRMIKKGVIESLEWGILGFALPRFKEYVLFRKYYF